MMTPEVLLKSLSDNTRLRIILLLAKTPAIELCVCDLIAVLEMEQPKVSRHLAVLRKNDLVSSRKSGQWVYYTINKALPIWALAVLENLINGSRLVEQFNADINALMQSKTTCE